MDKKEKIELEENDPYATNQNYFDIFMSRLPKEDQEELKKRLKDCSSDEFSFKLAEFMLEKETRINNRQGVSDSEDK